MAFDVVVKRIVRAEMRRSSAPVGVSDRIVQRRPWQESVVDALLTAEYHPLNLAVASGPTVNSRDAVTNHSCIEIVCKVAMISSSIRTHHDQWLILC